MKYCIADHLYDLRKEKGFTQEDLAFGICSSGTLSKIENGKRMPTMRTYEALMQRLGESPELFIEFAGKEELENYKTSRKIIRLLARGQQAEVRDILAEYRAHIKEKDILEQQFLLYAGAICESGERAPDEILERLKEALTLTMPGFKEEDLLEKRCMTYDEIMIWNNIAIQYRRLGEKENAFKILRNLSGYLELHLTDEAEMARIYPIILHNMSHWMNQEGKYEKAVEKCETGIRLCIEFGKLYPLANLLYQKAIGLERMGMDKNARELFRQSEIILQVVKIDRADVEREIEVAR